MSELGRSAKEATEWLLRFCGDVSKLITNVEENLRKRGVRCPWDATATYHQSKAYNQPDRWLPRFLYRVYILPGPDEPADNAQTRWAFFLVSLTPKLLPEPVAVWGVLSLKTPGNVWPFIDPWLMRDDGPPFLNRLEVTSWEVPPGCPEGVESFTYRACAMVELKDSQIVEEKVVQPIWDQLNR
jgi:hypothetical protein